jgi:hypothetical protein
MTKASSFHSSQAGSQFPLFAVLGMAGDTESAVQWRSAEAHPYLIISEPSV